MHNISIEATGTIYTLEFVNYKPSDKLEQSIRNFLVVFENNYSRFIPSSLLSQLNSKRKLPNNNIEFESLLRISQDLASLTKGSFNALNGNKLVKLGYGKNTEENLSHSNALDLEITKDYITLEGSASLDFGGFGKGYALSKIAEIITNDYYDAQVVISAGGDIHSVGKNYPIYVLKADQSGLLNQLELNNESVAVSFANSRQWKNAGKTLNHYLLDSNIYVVVQNKSPILTDGIATAVISKIVNTYSLPANFRYLDRLAKNTNSSINIYSDSSELFYSVRYNV